MSMKNIFDAMTLNGLSLKNRLRRTTLCSTALSDFIPIDSSLNIGS